MIYTGVALFSLYQEFGPGDTVYFPADVFVERVEIEFVKEDSDDVVSADVELTACFHPKTTPPPTTTTTTTLPTTVTTTAPPSRLL